MHSGETKRPKKSGKNDENRHRIPSVPGASALATFADRHIGPSPDEVAQMLRELGFENLDALVDATVPKNIRLDRHSDCRRRKVEN